MALNRPEPEDKRREAELIAEAGRESQDCRLCHQRLVVWTRAISRTVRVTTASIMSCHTIRISLDRGFTRQTETSFMSTSRQCGSYAWKAKVAGIVQGWFIGSESGEARKHPYRRCQPSAESCRLHGSTRWRKQVLMHSIPIRNLASGRWSQHEKQHHWWGI